MNVERLTVLADYLDQLTENPEHDKAGNVIEFDMTTWYDVDDECGTAACAMGHACMIPEFKDAGLKLGRDSCDDLSPTYNGQTGSYAAEVFFDLPDYLVQYLFMPDLYDDDTTPAEVAHRIRSVLSAKDFIGDLDKLGTGITIDV